jgi:hypothetical protein
MLIETRFQELEGLSECFAERRCVIAHDGKPAAPLWAVRGKSSNDQVAAQAQHLQGPRDVSALVLRVGQKVEGGAIMPNIKSRARLPQPGSRGLLRHCLGLAVF